MATKTNSEQIFEFLKDVILEISDNEASGVQPDTPLDDLGLESIDYVEILGLASKRFGVQLEESPFADDEPKTLDTLVSHIRGQLKAIATG